MAPVHHESAILPPWGIGLHDRLSPILACMTAILSQHSPALSQSFPGWHAWPLSSLKTDLHFGTFHEPVAPS
eukprot:1044091-Pelagomonas_calceolata.AAC.12